MYLSTDANYCPTTVLTNNHKDLHICQNNTPLTPLNISMCVLQATYLIIGILSH
jgi:hypothetical protein